MASIELPQGVAARDYDRACELGCRLMNPNASSPEEKSAWSVFVNGWNGLAYRLVAADSYSKVFCDNIQSMSGRDRYTEDHALFGFSFSALSAIECLYMAAYGIGAMLGPKFFPMDNQKRLNKSPEDVAKCFTEFEPSSSFTKALEAISIAPQLQELRELRNALSHRGLLGRMSPLSTHQALPQLIPSNPKALPSEFCYGTELVPALTETPLNWVIQSTNCLTNELCHLLE